MSSKHKMLDEEMMKALEADGEKLRQMTGEDHGPEFPAPSYEVAVHREMMEMARKIGQMENDLQFIRGTLAIWILPGLDDERRAGRARDLIARIDRVLKERT